MATNLKGMYFEKDLGDGTMMKLIRLRRPDDDNWALAIQLSAGTQKATCFLEDIKGVSFASELADGLVDFLEDISNMEIEKSEAEGDSFILRKQAKGKKDKTKDDFKDVELSTAKTGD
jgi:hypothetical protein